MSDKKKAIAAGGASAAAAVPVLLLVGAGSAHADDVTYSQWSPGQDLVAHIKNTTAVGSECVYNAYAHPAAPGLPSIPDYHSMPIWLGPNATHDLYIGTYYLAAPAIPIGTTWTIDVECGNDPTPTTVAGSAPVKIF